MLDVKITKEDVHYVAEFSPNTTEEINNFTMKSLHEMVYSIGRFIPMNTIHFHIPNELRSNLVSLLKMEYPGEVYEHTITVY